jgi:hypothetical protein
MLAHPYPGGKMRIVRTRSVSWFSLYRHCGRGHWCLYTRRLFFEIGEGRHKQPKMAGDGTYSVDGDGWPE